MTARDFCFWLQGFFELGGDCPTWGVNTDKVAVIKRHLNLVFLHDIDPKADGGDPVKKAVYDSVHSGGKDVKMRC